MAKEQDQTQDIEEVQDAETVETTEEDTSTATAVKTSEDFDKLIDAEGIPGEVPFEDDKPKETDTDSEEKDDTKADDKDTGEGDDDSEQQEQDEDEKDEKKDATDTGESPISKELAQKAIDLGLSEEEVQQLGTEQSVKDMVDALEAVTSEDEEKPPATEKTADKTEKSEKEDDLGLKFEDEDDIDPELLKNIKALDARHKTAQAKVEELTEKVNMLVGNIEERARREFVQRFDSMIENEGLELAQVFGKGKTDDLGLRTQAFKNRDAVRARMQMLAAASPVDKPLPSEQELFDLATASLFKKQIETAKSARLAKKTKAHAKSARVGRAATRKTGSKTGLERAYQTSRDFDDLIDMSD
jgi:hypothetical protein